MESDNICALLDHATYWEVDEIFGSRMAFCQSKSECFENVFELCGWEQDEGNFVHKIYCLVFKNMCHFT